MRLAVLIPVALQAASLIAQDTPDSSFIVAMHSGSTRPRTGGDFVFRVNGNKVAKLRFPTYFRLRVPPGVYSITLDEPASKLMVCHVIAGESCYVRAKRAGSGEPARIDLISFTEAAVELQNLIPLEPEKIYIRTWR